MGRIVNDESKCFPNLKDINKTYKRRDEIWKFYPYTPYREIQENNKWGGGSELVVGGGSAKLTKKINVPLVYSEPESLIITITT